jgi:hypothetical protein
MSETRNDGGVAKPGRKRWKTILIFAAVGLAAAVLAYGSSATFDNGKPGNPEELVTGIASVVLCPPSLLFAACIDCEASGWDGFYMFSIIGVLNTTLYGIVGAIVVGPTKNQS